MQDGQRPPGHSARPQLWEALRHPLRRRILGALKKEGKDRTLNDLFVGIGDATIGEISYHLEVLDGAAAVGSASRTGFPIDTTFASLVGDDQSVNDILRETCEDDQPDA
jgi:DNA-binding transcriptional ArsR family regulator